MHEHQHSYMPMAAQAHTYTTNTHACRHKLSPPIFTLRNLCLGFCHEQAVCMIQHSLALQYLRSVSSSKCRVRMPSTRQSFDSPTLSDLAIGLSDLAICLECGRRGWGGARKTSCKSRNNILLRGARLRLLIIIDVAIWASLAIWLSLLKRIDIVKPNTCFLALVRRVWSCHLGKKQKICNLYTLRHSTEILSTLYILGGLWRVALYWDITAGMWLVLNIGCHQV